MKRFAVILAGLMLAGLAAGCSNGDTKPPSSTGETPAPSSSAESVAALSGSVSTNGSTSMEKVIGALNEAFMAANPDVTVTYDPTGSGTGVTAAREGTADIGLASRGLKDTEKADLNETILALDGIAIIVNPANGVSDLSLKQIAAIYTGAVTNWSEVGGADGAIEVIGREAGSGTRDGFESITDTTEACKYNQELTSTGGVIQAVVSNPNAIGYASLSSVGDTVKALTVGGVAPSEDTVLDGTYAIQRPFVLATQLGQELNPAASAYFAYITSPAANEIIKNAGAMPVAKG